MSSSFTTYSRLLVVSCLFTARASAACSADNCFRAFFPCPSPSAVSIASSFCATITSGSVTATNFPTRATAACGTSPDRYVSACKCGPTCSGFVTSTATPTSTACASTPAAGLVYGDFECGIAPWSAQFPDAAATSTISSPGFTGNKCFEIYFHAPSVSKDLGVSARVLSPVVPVTPGSTYKLTFATWFDNGNAGFTGVMVNNRPIFTIDANNFGFGHWHFNQLPWTANATETTAVIKYEFLFGETTSVDKVDSVIFAPLSASCGSPVPVGLLPDGEFECGIGAWTVQVQDTAATASVKTGNANIGQSAFEVDFHSPPVSPQQEVSARIVSQALNVTPGVSYYLQFYTFFDNDNAGFIGVLINGAAVYTIDARDKGSGGWHVNDVTWVPAAGVTTATISFEFLFVAGTSSVDRIDSIVFQGFNP